MAIIEVDDVTYQYVSKYHTVEALKSVSTSFERERYYAIQGPSGSGKTTLLSLIALLDLPTKGEIIYDGIPVSKINPAGHRRKNVAVIYQSLNLLPQLTVAENVMYPMELNKIKSKEAGKRAHELIETVGLTDSEFSRFPHMLSGGQQQRVAIARALGTPAKVILADEPTGNLDGENSRIISSLLKNLAHEKGYCVIVATHDDGVASQADEILYITDGKIEQSRKEQTPLLVQ